MHCKPNGWLESTVHSGRERLITNLTIQPWKYVTKQWGMKPDLMQSLSISANIPPRTSCGLEYFSTK